MRSNELDDAFALVAAAANSMPVFSTQTGDTVAGQLTETVGAPAAGVSLTAAGTFSFTDADFADKHHVSASFNASASTTASALGSLTPVLITDSTNGAKGQLGWTYKVSAGALEYLAAGQTVKQTFDVTVDDGHGGKLVKPVTITLVGTNDAPVAYYKTGDASAAQVVETAGAPQPGATLTAVGTLSFTDVDLTDVHSVYAGFNAAASGTTTALGSLTPVLVADSTNGGKGQLSWTYKVSSGALDYLAAGQTVKQVFDVTVDDGHGGKLIKPVTITLVGTNDAPFAFYQSGDASSGQVAETVGKPQAGAALTATGTLSFRDVDLTDTHRVSVAFDATASGEAKSLGTLTPVLATDATGGATGQFVWTYQVAAGKLESLAAGQKVTEVFNVTVSDNHGGTLIKPVTITLTGTNDAPVLAYGAGDTAVGKVTETIGVPAAGASLTANGTFSFTDIDLTDAHLVSAVFDATASGETNPLGALTPVIATDATGGVTGRISWTYTVPASKLESLGAGQTLTEVFNVTISDGHGGTVVKPVTVTLVGTDEVSWKGPVDGNWTTASNWSTNAVPVASDNVVIDYPVVVTLSSGAARATQLITSASSTLSETGGTLLVSKTANIAGTFDQSGGIAVFSCATTIGTLAQSGGLLKGAGTVTVTGAATLSGGRESGIGTTIAQGGATLTAAPGASFDVSNLLLDGGRTLQLGGTSVATGNLVQIDLNGADPATNVGDVGTGTLTIAKGATFDDQTSDGLYGHGLYIWASDHGVSDDGTTASVINQGTFKKTGGSTSYIDTTFNNAGTVDVEAGTLVLYNGGNDTGASYTGAGTVAFTGGTRTLDSSSSITGNARFGGAAVTINGTYDAGTTTVDNGWAVFAGSATTDTLIQTDGSIEGDGTFTVTGAAFFLETGRQSGSGTTVVQGGATFANRFVSFALDGGRTLELHGSSTATGNYEQIDLNGADRNTGTSDAGSGILKISSGATFDDQTTDSGLHISATWHGALDDGSAAIVVNQGTFEKTGDAEFSTITTAFNNTGTVDVETGTLVFFRGGTDTGASYRGAGTVEFDGGTRTIDSASNITVNTTFSGGQTTVAGTYDTSFTTINAGTVVFSGAVTTDTLIQAGGVLDDNGTVTVTGAATLTAGLETGAGTTIVQGGATFGVSNEYTFALDGGHTLELGGNSVVKGSFASIDLNGGGGYVDTSSSDDGAGTLKIAKGATLDDQTSGIPYGGSLYIYASYQDDADDGSTASVVNEGTFKKTGSAVKSFIVTAFDNTGTVDVEVGMLELSNVTNDGSMDVGAAAQLQVSGTLTGTGNITLHGASSLVELQTSASNDIVFADDAQATLKIDRSSDFAGEIEGLNASSAIDLADMDFDTATLSYTQTQDGGTLVVTDGTHTASLALVGSYSLDDFTTAADGSGGTLIALNDDNAAIRWKAPVDGDWATASNWNANRLPNATDNVRIDYPVDVTFSTGTAKISQLVTSAGSTLTETGGTFSILHGANIEGTFEQDGGISNFFADATIGTLSQVGSGTLQGDGTVTVTGAAYLSEGGRESGSGTTIAQSGATFAGTIDSPVFSLDGGRTLQLGGISLTSGIVEIDLNGASPDTGVSDAGVGTLTIASGAIFYDTTDEEHSGGDSLVIGASSHGASDDGSTATFNNQGTFAKVGTAESYITTIFNNTGEVDVESGTLVLDGSVTNDGTMDVAASAQLQVNATLGGFGSITLHGASSLLELDSPTTNSVVFADDAEATLKIDHASDDALEIKGFNVNSAIDLADISFDTAALSFTPFQGGGTLVVTDETHTASLDFIGNYGLADFGSLVDDGSGGTLITLSKDNAAVSWKAPIDGDWATASNWNTNALPAATDNVRIDYPVDVTFSTGTATVGQLVTASGSTLSETGGKLSILHGANIDGAFEQSGGTVSFDNDATIATLTQSGGTLTGSGTVTVTGAAVISGGAQSGTGTTDVQSGITLDNSGFLLDGGRTLELGGSSAATGQYAYLDLNGLDPTTGISKAGSATLEIASGATFDDQTTTTTSSGLNIYADNQSASDDGSTATVINEGTFKKSGDSTSGIFTTFNNLGTVDVENGMLYPYSGGNDIGAKYQGAGTVVFYGGTRTIDSASVITGNASFTSGQTLIDGTYDAGVTTVNGGAVFFSGDATTASLVQIGSGTLHSSGTFTVTDSASLSGGGESGAGTTIVQGDAELSSSYFMLDGGRTLQIDGSAVATGQAAAIDLNGVDTTGASDAGSGTLKIAGGATFDDQTSTTNSSGLSIYAQDQGAADDGSTASVINEGTYKKTGDSTSSIFTSFDNAGTTDVENGTLIFDGDVVNGGMMNVGPSAALDVVGALTGTGSITLHGASSQVELEASASNDIAFADDAQATLKIDVSSDFAGTIEGLAVGSTIDLADMAAAGIGIGYAQSQGGGTLVLYDGVHSAHIALIGDYNLADFVTTDDGAGGTLITVKDAASAATIVWNVPTDGDWATASNWNTNMVPSSSDIVLINKPVDVTLGTGTAAIGRLVTSSSSTLSETGGMLTVSGASHVAGTFSLSGGVAEFDRNATIGTLNQTGGTLTAGGTITLTETAFLSGGEESGTGTTIAQDGVAFDFPDFPTNSIFFLNGGRSLQLQGSSVATGYSADLELGQYGSTGGSGTLTVTSGATFDDQTSGSGLGIAAFGSDAAGASVINQGTFKKTGSAGESHILTTFNNAGTVDIESGVLVLSGGGTDTSAVYEGAGTVEFGGGTRTLDNESTITANATFSGGQTTINGTYDVGTTTTVFGDVVFTGDVTTGTLVQQAGNGKLSSLGTVTVTGHAVFIGGEESGTGTTIVEGGATFGTPFGNSVLWLDGGRTLQLSGSSAATGYSSQIVLDGPDAGSGTLNIAGGATFDDQTSGDINGAGLNIFAHNISGSDDGDKAIVINQGTYKKTGAATSTIGVTFNNTGIIDLETGTIIFQGGVVNDGVIDAGAGTTLQVMGSLTGTGTVIIHGGSSLNLDVELEAPTTNKFIFTDNAAATLKIDHSSDFAGSIKGFGPKSVIDLGDMIAGSTILAYTPTSGGGTLVVSDGTHTASLALVGNYSVSDFTTSVDGFGTQIKMHA